MRKPCWVCRFSGFIQRSPTFTFTHLTGERGGSVVECRTPEREVRGSRPTVAVLCPWARHFTPRKYWLITQEAMAPSRHDWKIVDWDVKPQHNQPTNTPYMYMCLIGWVQNKVESLRFMRVYDYTITLVGGVPSWKCWQTGSRKTNGLLNVNGYVLSVLSDWPLSREFDI